MRDNQRKTNIILRNLRALLEEMEELRAEPSPPGISPDQVEELRKELQDLQSLLDQGTSGPDT